MSQDPVTGTGGIQPLVSDFAEDADMADLVDFFIDEMTSRIECLTQAWEQARIEDLRVIAHQLKGAGAGYGFQPVTTAAAMLEDAIVAGEGEGDSLQSRFEELLLICRRVAAASD
jgi:HPt (histidine-containing phosphotransfer) domain-containing protein